MTTHTSALRHRAALALAAALAVPVALALPAHASDDEVIREGACTGVSDWKLKAKPDDGRLEVEAEVDSNRVGQRWQWRLRQDGALVGSGTRTTLAPSGSFEVERKLPNTAGSDTFAFRAVNPASGEVCRGTVTL